MSLVIIGFPKHSGGHRQEHQAPGGPVGGVGRGRLQRVDQDRLDDVIADGAGRARPRCVVQSFQPLASKAAPPFGHRDGVHFQLGGDLSVRPSAEASTIREPSASTWAELGRRAQRCQRRPFVVGQGYMGGGAAKACHTELLLSGF